jgi:hypothetical protein
LARETLVDEGRSIRLATFADGKLAAVERSVGRGRVLHLGWWAGISYSAQVRRADFDMRADLSPALRDMIVIAARRAGVESPVEPAEPLVEAIAMTNDRGPSISLINWAYMSDRAGPRGERLRKFTDLRVKLPTSMKAEKVRSLQLDVDLPVVDGVVILPSLDKADVLVAK